MPFGWAMVSLFALEYVFSQIVFRFLRLHFSIIRTQLMDSNDFIADSLHLKGCTFQANFIE